MLTCQFESEELEVKEMFVIFYKLHLLLFFLFCKLIGKIFKSVGYQKSLISPQKIVIYCVVQNVIRIPWLSLKILFSGCWPVKKGFHLYHRCKAKNIYLHVFTLAS